jgi:hypothetical protein
VETIAAAAAPPVLAVAVVFLLSRDRELRRASLLFAALTALWLAPAWLSLRTPVSLDFLLDMPPLESRKPAGYLQKNFLLNDVPLQFLPWREAAVRAWRDGSLPFLDRHAGSGTPLWENLQSAVLYPPNLLSLPLSTFAWPLFLAASKLMVALIGMWLLLRELRVGKAGAIFGAVAYAFCVFNIGFLLFPHTSVTTLLPLLLFFFERRGNGQPRAAIWASLTLFVMFTGGHPESLFHCAFVAVPWCGLLIARKADSRRELIRDFALAGVVALLLAAPLLVPFASYLPHTQRMHDIRTTGGFLSTPPPDLTAVVPFVVPNYFGNPRVHNYRHPFNFNELCSQFAGLTALVFAIGALVTDWRRCRAGAALFVVLLILSTEPVWMQRLVSEIPLFGVTAHGRLRFALALLMAIGAAIGLDRFLRGESRDRFAIIAASVAVLVAVVCIASYPVFAKFGIRRLVFFTEIAALAGCALVAVSRWVPRMATGSVLIALLWLDLFGVTGFYNPANGRDLYYPSTPAIEAMTEGGRPYRIAGIGRTFQPNRGVFHQLEDIRPHDPMAFRPYVQMLDAGGLSRSTYFEEFPSLPQIDLLDALGVRYLIAPPGFSSPLPVSFRGSDAQVYENDGATPRYSVPAPAAVRLIEYGPAHTVLLVDAPAETILSSSEVALPGWSLTRNSQPWQMTAVGKPLLSWKVPAGRSRFELRYRPVNLPEGALLGFLGAIAVALWLILLRRRG